MSKKILLKHIAPVGMAALIAASIPTMSAFAEKKGDLLISPHPISQQIEQANYLFLDGTVTEIHTSENGYTSILVSTTEEETSFNEIRFSVDAGSFLFDQLGNPIEISQFEVGSKVKAYYYKLQPMTLSLPPMTHGPLLILDTGEGFGSTELSFFNKELVNPDNTLKLNIAEDTPLFNQAGEVQTKEDLMDQDLLVFYDITTRSIPAQTTPNKVIIFTHELDEEETDTTVADFIAATVLEDHVLVGDTTLAPLRTIAEHLEYEVSWEEETQQIRLQRGNASFTISINQIQYGYNRSLGQFDLLPVVQDGTIYVPMSFIDTLLEIEAN